jgi:uncharacterized protein (TIGR03435 family)
MMQKLLAERFQLVFHRERKAISVYALRVAEGGPKLTKSKGNVSVAHHWFHGTTGELNPVGASMADFADVLQQYIVDRPVFDQTGITGTYDFALNWKPDNSQFPLAHIKMLPAGSTNLPPLSTAIQQQLGLRLDTVTAPTEVMVIDHVEKPSFN